MTFCTLPPESSTVVSVRTRFCDGDSDTSDGRWPSLLLLLLLLLSSNRAADDRLRDTAAIAQCQSSPAKHLTEPQSAVVPMPFLAGLTVGRAIESVLSPLSLNVLQQPLVPCRGGAPRLELTSCKKWI